MFEMFFETKPSAEVREGHFLFAASVLLKTVSYRQNERCRSSIKNKGAWICLDL
jgi:hypothetical protein